MDIIVTPEKLREEANRAFGALWANAEDMGREPKIYLHWTAGHYQQITDHCHEGYHVCITGDGLIHLLNNFDVTTSGTWKRNTGAINLAICGCFDAGSQSIGTEPPKAVQIEKLAECIAAIADGLWLTIDKRHVLTHGEAANNEDGYYDAHMPYSWWNDSYGDGDTRGDLEYLGTPESPRYNPHATDGSRGGDVLRGKANWYRNEWKKAKE